MENRETGEIQTPGFPSGAAFSVRWYRGEGHTSDQDDVPVSSGS